MRANVCLTRMTLYSGLAAIALAGCASTPASSVPPKTGETAFTIGVIDAEEQVVSADHKKLPSALPKDVTSACAADLPKPPPADHAPPPIAPYLAILAGFVIDQLASWAVEKAAAAVDRRVQSYSDNVSSSPGDLAIDLVPGKQCLVVTRWDCPSAAGSQHPPINQCTMVTTAVGEVNVTPANQPEYVQFAPRYVKVVSLRGRYEGSAEAAFAQTLTVSSTWLEEVPGRSGGLGRSATLFTLPLVPAVKFAIRHDGTGAPAYEAATPVADWAPLARYPLPPPAPTNLNAILPRGIAPVSVRHVSVVVASAEANTPPKGLTDLDAFLSKHGDDVNGLLKSVLDKLAGIDSK